MLDQEVKEGYVEASKEAVLNYIMLDQVPFWIHAMSLYNISGGKRATEHFGGTKDVGSSRGESTCPMAPVILAGENKNRNRSSRKVKVKVAFQTLRNSRPEWKLSGN